MPIKAHNLGPGTLTLGSGPLDVTLQVTSCKISVTEYVSVVVDIKVLSLDVLEGGESVDFDFALEGNILQDLNTAGVVAWSWTNKGTEQDFVFTPNDAAAASIAGVLKPVPLQVGGDELERKMASDFTWRCVGEPVPTWGA
jgi:hypothetical protein